MIIYILLRLFVPKKNYTLEGDELRYLTTSKNFYRMFNKDFYDLHPPFYAWLMREFGAKWWSGVMVSFLCSIGLFLVSSKLYTVLGLTPDQKYLALTFLAFNYTLIYYSNRIFRYQLIAFLGTSVIYCLVTAKFFIAGLLWGLLGLTCTFAGLRMFWAWVFFPNWLTLVNFLAVYSSWFITKAQVYRERVYHPSGIEGMLERVYPFTFRQLLTPMYFPWCYSYYTQKEVSYTLKGWFKRVGGVFGLYPPLTILVPVALFFVVKGALVSPLWVGGLVAVLLYPSLMKRYLPRNSIIAIPLLGFLLVKGLPHIPSNWLFLASGLALVGFLLRNRVFMLTKPKIKARITANFLDKLPKDGVIVDGMICQALVYRTNKRVVVLSYEPNPVEAFYQTSAAIAGFKINYAVFSEFGIMKGPKNYPAIKLIKNLKLIKTIYEDIDTYYIYEIPKLF